jgi:hypothetical protein
LKSLLSQAVSYAVIAARAKDQFDDNLSNNPPELRPRWESQPVESQELWLNKAARQIDADQLAAASCSVGASPIVRWTLYARSHQLPTKYRLSVSSGTQASSRDDPQEPPDYTDLSD